MIIVQIGSNKGNTDNDPVWAMCNANIPQSYDWELILVEPNPKGVAILSKNYIDAGFKNVKVINCGVSDKEEDLILYIDNDVPGSEASQHCSMKKSHMHKMGHADSVITEHPIKCVTLSSILPPKVDYLQIDTEGYDFKVLMGCDFTRHKIDIIEYEHVHISEEENSLLRKRLEENGFRETGKTAEDTQFQYVGDGT